MSAKEVLLKKIRQNELENIKNLGFIQATEGSREDSVTKRWNREVAALEHYLHH